MSITLNCDPGLAKYIECTKIQSKGKWDGGEYTQEYVEVTVPTGESFPLKGYPTVPTLLAEIEKKYIYEKQVYENRRVFFGADKEAEKS